MGSLDKSDLEAIKLMVETTIDEKLSRLPTLEAIKLLVETTIDEKLEEILDDKLGKLPNKEEFYSKMDEVVGELKTVREEQPLQSHRLSNHEDRIQNIESHLGFASNY